MKVSFRTVFCLCLAAALAPAAVAGAAPAAAPPSGSSGGGEQALPPAVQAILERLDRAQRGVTTLRADVVETRTMALLNQPQKLSGQLSFQRPGRIRWEYVRPEKRVYVLADGSLTGWIPARNTVEKVNLSRYEQRVRRTFPVGQESKALLKDFTVSLAPPAAGAAGDELVLVPKSRRMAKRVQEIRLFVDRADGLPHRVVFRTPDGSVVSYELSNVQVNHALAPDTFALKTPPNAKVEFGMSSLGLMNPGDDAEVGAF